MSSAPAIRIQQLGKCYQIYDKPADRLKQSLWRGRRRYFREFWALQDAAFEVGKGETVGIIGRNGSGKSTLLQMIAGTLTPTIGNIEVNGRLAALLELGSGFNPEFSGRENVYMYATILGLSKEEVDNRFDEIAAFADIGDFIDQPLKSYSSGMSVRLAFAVSACIEPDILIIDEALAVGDMAFQMKCMERLERLTRSGTTLLFVSHDIYSVKAFCQRAIYLEGGRIKATGSASDMVELYLLDIREAQRRASGDVGQVRIKSSLNTGKGFAFGTEQGHVLSAEFADGNVGQASFLSGEPIAIRITMEFDASVRKPAFSLFVHDHRMIDLAGHYFMIENDPGMTDEGRGTRRCAFEVAFPAIFNAGQYFVTIRLEDRLSDSNFLPIDKQVGALSFNIMRPADSQFLGMVSLPFESRPIPPSEVSLA